MIKSVPRCLMSILLLQMTSIYSLAQVKVYVDDFEPFINKEGTSIGSAAKILRTISEFADKEIEFRYVNYSDAMALLSEGRHALSYPYLYTESRAQLFLYSKPITVITNRVYYSRQTPTLADNKELKGMLIGVVDGYSYGANIDNLLTKTSVFRSELEALNALIQQEIDALPMAEAVMQQMLSSYFPQHKELIATINNIRSTEALHLIAPKNAFGEKMIEVFDAAISRYLADRSLPELSVKPAPRLDIAELIPAEGFPAILGTSIDKSETYTLPIGTEVAVVDWSEAILQASVATEINRNMLLTSQVVILNGPHLGKELLVRNMHLQLINND